MGRHCVRAMMAVALCWGWFAASPAQGEDPAYWKWRLHHPWAGTATIILATA